jgi:hypothetical protein
MKQSLCGSSGSFKLPDQQNLQCHWRIPNETLTEEIE